MTPPNRNWPAPPSLRDLPDRELVQRCKTGDAGSFNELVGRHQEKIFNAVYRFCNNWEDACDITQRAFINAFRKIGEFKGDSAFSTWMYRIAFNQSVSFRRETGRQKAMSLSSKDDDGLVTEPAFDSNPAENMERDDHRKKVQQALTELEEDDRQIIILKDLQNYSYDEIASIIDIPKGTVRSRLHRARLALRAKLKTYMGTLK